ncbi:MAG: CBS domain-containing protein [Bacteroidales bacterium]|nr:CBS domain-containing protein [Bacteroidales bacterium]
MLAKDLISGTISPLLLSDTANKAMDLMEEFKISHLPVVSSYNTNNKTLLGLISEESLLNIENPSTTLDNISNILTSHFILENQHIYDAIFSMGTHKLSVIPVITNSHQYIGSINTKSVIKFLNKFTAINEAGGIIVMEMNKHDYSLSHIAQIVESQDSKIYNSYVSYISNIDKIEVTIKINTENTDAVVQSLERYNYIIKYTFNNTIESISKVEENYESLMNYLNI